MATLPPVKRFVLDDYNGITTVSAFCSKFFYPMNLFLNAVYSALSSGLTIQQNMIGIVNASTNISSNSSGVATTTINWPDTQSPPQGVAVIACTQSSSATMYPLVSWSYAAGVVSISMQFVKVSSGAIVSAAASSYSVTFWVTGG
jgi:hypothetical protein